MTNTINLDLPYLLPSQAQKHVTHNEALTALDALVQLSVVDRDRTAPPETPAEGERHIVASPASGVWAGKEATIAAFEDGGWRFYPPRPGWLAWCEADQGLFAFGAGGWTDIAGLVAGAIASLQNLDFLGVASTADSTNRLSVASAASLFNHAGGGHQLKVNKAAENETASLLFQDAFGGRAEIGLCGNDELQMKVSPDGSHWTEVLRLLPSTGQARFPGTSICEGFSLNLFQDGGRFAGAPEGTGMAAGAFKAPAWLMPYNGAAFSAGGKFASDNSTNGGAGAALPEPVAALIARLKQAGLPRRYGPEFHVMRVDAGAGTASPRTIGAVTRYLPFTTRPATIATAWTAGLHVRVESGSIGLAPQPEGAELYVDGAPQASDLVLTPADGWKQALFVAVGAQETTCDYNTSMFRLYAEPGASFLVALPFLLPARLYPRPGELFARMPSVQAWR